MLTEVDRPVDVVDVFRPAAEAVDIARQAVMVGAKVLWLQLGIRNDEARQVAEKAGLTVVMDRCMGATHRELGLGPARGRVGERRGEALLSFNDHRASSASTDE